MTQVQAEHGTLRSDGERCAVGFRRLYDFTAEELWAALTDPKQLGRWLANAPRFDREVGGRVELVFGDGSGDQHASGRILTWDEPHVLEYEWCFPGEDDSIVRFELEPQEFGTLLVLDHRQLGRVAGAGYSAGWHAHLDALGRVYAFSDDAWTQRFEELLPDYRAQPTRSGGTGRRPPLCAKRSTAATVRAPRRRHPESTSTCSTRPRSGAPTGCASSSTPSPTS